MKKLLLIFSFILAGFASNAQGLWFSQSTNFVDTSSGVRNISVVDTNVVWISAYSGCSGCTGIPRRDYSRTIDGGATWVTGIVPGNPNWDMGMIDAVDANNAWAIFYNTAALPTAGLGQIWHTFDGGGVWSQQAPNTFSTAGQSFANVIHFWNQNDGVVVGDPVNGYFEIYTTSNGGATWDSVPVANIPFDSTGNEAAWTTHIDVVGDTVWFDTNMNRVFRSVDRGLHWTVSSTGLNSPYPGTIDICFYSSMNGIARYYNDTTITNEVVETNDGGTTWSPITPTGYFFGSDVKRVPGTISTLVSTGASNDPPNGSGFRGSSISSDGGHTWTELEMPGGLQRGALGIADSMTMWCGGFTDAASTGGIFKFVIIPPVACGDPSVTPGTSSSSALSICGNDTITLTASGVHSPVNGTYSGSSWVITSTDISNSHNATVIVGSWPFIFPAPVNDIRTFINDAQVIDGTNNPYGIYYFTPVVFGNAEDATGTGSPISFHQLLTDTGCTYFGTSVAVDIIDPAICFDDGVTEINSKLLNISSILRDRNTLEVSFTSSSSGKMSINIMDLTGRVLKNVTHNVPGGTSLEVINVSDLSSGIYIVDVELNGYRASNKVMKY